MGDFQHHIRHGYTAHALFSAVLLIIAPLAGLSIPESVGLAAVAAPLAIAGAIFPDVDHHASRPHRMFVFAASVLALVGSISALARPLSGVVDVLVVWLDFGVLTTDARSAAVVLGLSFLTAGGVVYLIRRFRPAHRGVTHHPAVGLALAVLVGAVTWLVAASSSLPLAPLTGVVCGAAFAIGVASHLHCDGILLRSAA